MISGTHYKEIYGAEHSTTNQRMELRAVAEALKTVKLNRRNIEVYSDSAYIVNAFQNEWIATWQRNGWLNSKKQSVANQDLWLSILEQMRRNNVVIIKVKGHSGDKWNERCDELARQAIKELGKDE